LKKNEPRIVALAKSVKNGSGKRRHARRLRRNRCYRQALSSSGRSRTPFCVTVDFQSLDDDSVTIRDRDTMAQIRLPLADLYGYVRERI